MTFRLAPVSREDAAGMIDGIKAAEILKGVRGGEGVNRNALAGLIENVSKLIADFPEIAELDLNPVFASKKGAVAADTVGLFLIGLPVLLAGTWAGLKLYGLLDESGFRKLVLVLLLVSGVVLMF